MDAVIPDWMAKAGGEREVGSGLSNAVRLAVGLLCGGTASKGSPLTVPLWEGAPWHLGASGRQAALPPAGCTS